MKYRAGRTGLSVIAGLAVLFVMLIHAPLAAQEQHGINTITIVKTKLDKAPEFEKIIRDEWIPGMKQAKLPWLSGWLADPFGPAGTYVFASEMANFAVNDGPHPLMKVMGEEKFMSMLGRLRACAESIERHAVDVDMKVSTMPEGSPGVAVYVQADVAPGQGAAMEKFVAEEVAPAMAKAGMKGFLMQRERFGSGPALHLVVFAENYAKLDKGHPFIQAYGPEKGAAMIQKANTLMQLKSVYPLRHLPALSYGEE